MCKRMTGAQSNGEKVQCGEKGSEFGQSTRSFQRVYKRSGRKFQCSTTKKQNVVVKGERVAVGAEGEERRGTHRINIWDRNKDNGRYGIIEKIAHDPGYV